MKIIRWIAAVAYACVIMFMGSALLSWVTNKLYVQSLTLWGAIRIIIITIVSYIVVETAMFIAIYPTFYIVYGGTVDGGSTRLHWIVVPVLLWNLFMVSVATWNKAFNGMPWAAYIQITIQCMIMIEVTTRYIRKLRKINGLPFI